LGRRDAPETTDLSGSIRLGARSKLLEELASWTRSAPSWWGIGAARSWMMRAPSWRRRGESTSPRACGRGDVVETISEIEEEARVIVIGKRGEAADFAKGHLGSNLERIVRTAKRPVFVAARAFSADQEVLVAYDGSRLAMKAVDQIARSPLFSGLAVTVVTVGAETSRHAQGAG
jgi:nucleotide-binding universal stress UspA family protein